MISHACVRPHLLSYMYRTYKRCLVADMEADLFTTYTCVCCGGMWAEKYSTYAHASTYVTTSSLSFSLPDRDEKWKERDRPPVKHLSCWVDWSGAPPGAQGARETPPPCMCLIVLCPHMHTNTRTVPPTRFMYCTVCSSSFFLSLSSSLFQTLRETGKKVRGFRRE